MGKKKKDDIYRPCRLLSDERKVEIEEEYGVEDISDLFFCPEEYGIEVVEKIDSGYESENIAMKAIVWGDSCEAVTYVIKIGGRYYIYMMESVISGTGSGKDLIYWESDSLEAALEQCKEIVAQNVVPYEKQISELREKIPYDVYFQSRSVMSGFRIYSDHLLVAEHVFSLDAGEIVRAIENMRNFEKENNIKISELYKPGREWNNNQRYYIISGTTEYGEFHEKVSIPSSTQGRYREPVDIIRKANLDFEKITKEMAEKDKRWKNELDKKKRMVEEGGRLTKEERESLWDYLNEQNVMQCCDCTLKHTQEWLMGHIAQERRGVVIAELELGGGFCDCEVVMNYFAED